MSAITLRQGSFIIPLRYIIRIQTARPSMKIITIIAAITPELDEPASTMMVLVWSV